jgi:uncharacterized protein (DUF2147 family)
MHPDPFPSRGGGGRKPLGAGLALSILSALLLVQSRDAGAQAPNPVFGVWFDDTGKGAVEIRDCNRRLCGHIVWLKEPNDTAGRPLTDGYNPEPAQRTRPICGLQVIGELLPQSDGSWDSGWIYDPKEGKSYSVALQLANRNTLVVTGYLGMKLFGQSFSWSRAPGDLPRCGTAKEAVASPAPPRTPSVVPPKPTPAQRRP